MLQAANGLVSAAYLEERKLDRRTKELIFIVSLTVIRAARGTSEPHPGGARPRRDPGGDPGSDRDHLPEAGVVAFQHGFEAWAEVVGAEGLEPAVAVHDAGTA